MKRLADAFSEQNVTLRAWCLMSNHVHLLVHAPLNRIANAMMKLESGYAKYFNWAHGRVGTLFQGRYTSVPIESSEQLLAAVRYIHLNPVKQHGSIYTRWSSYSEYLGRRTKPYADCSLVLAEAGGVESFKALHDIELQYEQGLPRHRITDDQAMSIAREVLEGMNPHAIKAMNRKQRDEYLVQLREAGLSAKQIARITSIGMNIIYRAKRN